MKSSLLMLASAVLLSSPALAQGDVAADAADLLAPSGAWLVGPTTLADGSDAEGGGIPCVMVNKFSNGSELRFSGGGQEILALALNVGAPTFEVNQSYLITISFEGQPPINLPAEAFSEDTVVVGTEPGQAFYKFLKEKQSMTLQLGTGVMAFSLLGVPHSLKRLEECYKPATPVTPAAAAPAPAPLPTAAATGIQKLDEVSAQKVDQLMSEITGNALPAAPVQPAPDQTAPAPSAPVKAAAAAPVSKSADVPVAENTPPPQSALKDARPRDIMIPGTSPAVTAGGPQMRWRVMKGASLQSTLEVWAQSMQARVVWKAVKPFSMPESLSMQGTFEAAVEAVLSRFPRGQARPVGKIYIDPSNKQKILVIEEDSPPLPASAEGSYAPIISP